MQESVLEFLRCPVCKGRLQLQIIETITKRFTTGNRIIIESGILFCSCHLLFPIVETVPRMLIESFTEHDDFLRQHVPGFFLLKRNLLEKYGDLISAARKRNQPAKASFSFEWNLLKGKKEINVWHLNKEEYKTQLFDELDLPDQFF